MAYKVQGACVDIEILVMGPIENNVYLVGDGAATIVVDPSCGEGEILEALGGRAVDAIVLTHAHWDHVGAAAALHRATGAQVIASAVDAPVIDGSASLGPGHRRFEPCEVTRAVADGDVVETGSMKWRVIETPGHTPGSICLFLDSATCGREGMSVLASGDTLFAGTHGRTDFEGGDPAAMIASLKRLSTLPDDTLVLPGHNNLTLIAREKPWLSRL